MQLYEVRILRPDGGTALIAAETHWDNYSAIRAAARLANGRQFEVWRGMECVYDAALKSFSKPLPPDRLHA